MKLSQSNDLSSRSRFAKAKVHPLLGETHAEGTSARFHPLLFIGLLMLIFLAPSVVTAFSGGKIPAPQLPSHSFAPIKR